MANNEKILVIGRHPDIMVKVIAMLQQHGYNAIGAQWNDEALAIFTKEKIAAVIIGGGVDEESRQLFHREFNKINPQVKFIYAHPQTILRDVANSLNRS